MAGIGTGGIGQALTASGGITPEQAELAQYNAGQGIVQDMYKIGSTMPHSTGMTQATIGSEVGGIQQAGQMSQSDAAVQSAFLNAQNKNLFSGIGGALGTIAGKR